jgi:hypothetical protein
MIAALLTGILVGVIARDLWPLVRRRDGDPGPRKEDRRRGHRR